LKPFRITGNGGVSKQPLLDLALIDGVDVGYRHLVEHILDLPSATIQRG
jgi:hypothetical protein